MTVTMTAAKSEKASIVSDFELRGMIPLEDFEQPSTPNQETLRIWGARLKRLVSQSEEAPFINSEQLQATALSHLDEIVSPPACGPVIDEINKTVNAWLRDETTPVKFIVTPPCDENCVIETWAKRSGFNTLDAPDRSSLISSDGFHLPAIKHEELVIIPRLADWFLRHRNGLRAVRELLQFVSESDQRFVFGCNSWAWSFLVKAVEADMVLPQPEIFRPFDEERLHEWLSALASADSTQNLQFRSSKTGGNVLSSDSAADHDKDFFETLAARSLGIPWVAWHMWRKALRSEDGEMADDDAEPFEAERGDREERKTTLWISEIESSSLPSQHTQTALLVLHSLLIHNRLTLAELKCTLPAAGDANMLPALISRGFIHRDGPYFLCTPSAYPDIRSALSAAGFPMSSI